MLRHRNIILLLLMIFIGYSCNSSSSSNQVSQKATQLSRSEAAPTQVIIEPVKEGLPVVKEGDSIIVVRSDNTRQVIQVLVGESSVQESTIPGYSQVMTGLVVRVSDGDTVVLLDAEKTQHRIRLDGIDCPESKQSFGSKATQFVRDKIGNETVNVHYNKKDRYGRVLGVVVTQEGENINEALLANGLAWHYKYYNDNPVYAKLEQEAKDKKLNIWSEKNPIEPYEFRKMQKKK